MKIVKKRHLQEAYFYKGGDDDINSLMDWLKVFESDDLSINVFKDNFSSKIVIRRTYQGRDKFCVVDPASYITPYMTSDGDRLFTFVSYVQEELEKVFVCLP